jgi:uncharacterized protein (TIGR03492 family)
VARVLFVSNGHGEAAIADRIAEELRALDPAVQIDHLALVGRARSRYMTDVGPQRAMPSGGLIAMGNVKNIARDVRGGLIGLTLEQRRFLVQARGRYDRAVTVGDVFALLMTLAARAPVTYVGTAKSVNVAPYGPIERRVLARASEVYVRDEATARRLRAQGLRAEAPGNVIVDLFAAADDARADAAVRDFTPAIAVFPGSREAALEDARFLLDVVRRVAQRRPALGAAVSIAPMLDPALFAHIFARDGWDVVSDAGDERMPFVLRAHQRTVARAWHGPIGPLLSRVQLVIGQAGTANEAAAAAGVPVVAFERGNDRKTAWYRMRQHGLLGDALAVFSGEPDAAVQQLEALLDDAPRRARMGAVGRERMGGPGGARAIARVIAGRLA